MRRFGDVLLTLLPLLVAGAATLELMVLMGEPFNFANAIALPLLLGVGVAFKIYYIMAWRAGQTDLLQSSLTRAVIWSALTTRQQALAEGGPKELLAALRQKYPTGALAAFQAPDRPWRDLAPGSAKLVEFVRPRDLAVT